MKNLIIMTMALCFSMCNKEKKEDAVLSIERTLYTGNELRIDGYYYHEFAASGKTFLTVDFFYKNGIYLTGYTFNKEELEEREEKFQNREFYNNIKDEKESWGVFIINNNSIIIEKWYYPYQLHPASTIKYYGTIMNDTTFTITKIKDEDGVRERNDIYHFKEFSPKPDSTNKFIL